MRLLLPVLISALVPARLTDVVASLDAITERLLQSDGRRGKAKQVDAYRSRYEPATWSRLVGRC
jgi:hypothetical protein